MQKRNGPKKEGKGSRMRRRLARVPKQKAWAAKNGGQAQQGKGRGGQQVKSGRPFCAFYNKRSGCKNGVHCSFQHVRKDCRFGECCRNKETCHFLHPVQQCVPIQPQPQMQYVPMLSQQYAYAQQYMPVYYAQQYSVPQPAQMDKTAIKQAFGEKIFPSVQEREPKLAGKITGMLLELDNTELSILSEDEGELEKKIKEAMEVLRAHSQ